ncbi:MAG: hypothetical protein HQL95_15165, partial [Magnetococcales bacterium]|nr:hypothetical protein [Magnetococcales bacterium]
VGNGFVGQGYLTALGPVNTLSVSQGAAQNIFSDILVGEVQLTAAFRVTTATLSGVISDNTTGRLAGPVTLTLRSSAAQGFFMQASTNGSGAYAVQLPVGESLLIEMTAKGTGMLYRGYVDPFGNLVAVRPALSGLTLYGDMTLNGAIIDAMGVATYAISGKATDLAATPQALAGVAVRAVSVGDASRVFATMTDTQGNYQLDVEAGSYKIEYTATGYAGGLASGAGTAVILGGEAAAQTYLLGGSGASSLTLNVALKSSSGGGGNLPDKITIAGNVTGGVGGLANILVEFQPLWEENTGAVVELVTVKTDTTGHYAAAIYPGKYRVQFRAVYWDATANRMVTVPGVLGDGGFADGNGQVTASQEAAQSFTFATDDQLNAVLPSGARVSGLVSDGAGQGVANVKVEFQPNQEDGAAEAPWVETTTDTAGHYVAFVQPNAPYLVHFNTNYWDWQTNKQIKTNGLSGYSDGSSGDGLNGDSSKAKEYKFTDDTEINARLATGITIQGMVTAGDGLTAVANVLVRLQPEWDAESGESGSWGETYTDVDGRYTFSAMPGKYRVEYLTSYWKWDTQEQKTLPGNLIGGFADGQGGIGTDWSSAKLFKIGATTEINTRLLAGMMLSGTIAKADATPVNGAVVNVHSRDWSRSFHAKADDQGAFSLSVTPGVEYQVEVWPAYCEPGNTDETVGCGSAFVSFLGGNWITPPASAWVTGWQSEDPATRPVVVASGGNVPAQLPGTVMAQTDPHMVTSILMDRSLVIGVQVDAGIEAYGRVMDDGNHGIPHAWINTDFGATATDQDGYFTLHLPSATLVSQAGSTFRVEVLPGGYEDAESHAWVQSSDFLGGKVSCATNPCRLTAEDGLASGFGADLATGVAWPFENLGNGGKGLIVQVSRGVVITGNVTRGANGQGNVWVNARSHDAMSGMGTATGGNGDFTLRVPTPAESAPVWYEVTLWSDLYLAPDPVLVKVTAGGVVGV